MKKVNKNNQPGDDPTDRDFTFESGIRYFM
jgi:hypothetical protein